MSGGQINTDAIDNSGGVDTSDHEVNIKILLDLLVKKGIVPNKEARNRMLAEMEGDVAALVLEDNRNQARALTLDGLRSAAHYDEFVDLVGNMERNGMIDRSGVQLPSRDSLLQSPQKARGLPRPLLADLLGYAKMWVYEKLVRSSLPDNPVADPFLLAYFPKPWAGISADISLNIRCGEKLPPRRSQLRIEQWRHPPVAAPYGRVENVARGNRLGLFGGGCKGGGRAIATTGAGIRARSGCGACRAAQNRGCG
jgi:hypothetical protein